MESICRILTVIIHNFGDHMLLYRKVLTGMFQGLGDRIPLGMLQRRVKKPPESYMCHICFDKGHYITDCPQVRGNAKILLIKRIQ